jgi:hypothetical protein
MAVNALKAESRDSLATANLDIPELRANKWLTFVHQIRAKMAENVICEDNDEYKIKNK